MNMDKDAKTRSFIFKKMQVDAMLAGVPMQGDAKQMLEPLKTLATEHNVPFNVIELIQHTNKVEVHTYLNDLWFCFEGEVKFLCGGAMQNAHTRVRSDGSLDETEMRAEGLEGAQEIIVKPGDWLWIPAGEPHQHITQGTARLMIIKIPHNK